VGPRGAGPRRTGQPLQDGVEALHAAPARADIGARPPVGAHASARDCPARRTDAGAAGEEDEGTARSLRGGAGGRDEVAAEKEQFAQ
jgi:hypothetical protein